MEHFAWVFVGLLFLLTLTSIGASVSRPATQNETVGYLTVTLVTYDNRAHRTSTGATCDPGWFGSNKCDPRLTVCLTTPAGANDTSAALKNIQWDKCNVGGPWYFGPYDNEGFVNFSTKAANSTRVKIMGAWRGAQLRVRVEEMNRNGLFSGNKIPGPLIDTFEFFLNGRPTHSTTRLSLTGQSKAKTSLLVEVRMQCADKYYDNLCSTFCEVDNVTRSAGYICDPKTGTVVCNSQIANASCITNSSFVSTASTTVNVVANQVKPSGDSTRKSEKLQQADLFNYKTSEKDKHILINGTSVDEASQISQLEGIFVVDMDSSAINNDTFYNKDWPLSTPLSSALSSNQTKPRSVNDTVVAQVVTTKTETTINGSGPSVAAAIQSLVSLPVTPTTDSTSLATTTVDPASAPIKRVIKEESTAEEAAHADEPRVEQEFVGNAQALVGESIVTTNSTVSEQQSPSVPVAASDANCLLSTLTILVGAMGLYFY